MALEEKLKVYQEKIKHKPLTSAIITIILLVFLLIAVPYLDISHRGIDNATVEATLENQDRATLAQIFGGAAIGIGLYYTWRRIGIAEEDLKATQENLKVTQENLKVSQDGQITERFTRAVEQLGSDKIEIRLGGIYALERIASESDRDYWPIMEILTAYVRKNSPNDDQHFEKDEIIPLDIQAIITILGRCKNSFYKEIKCLNLTFTYLHHTDFSEVHLEGADFEGADLHWSYIRGVAHFERTNFENASLEIATFDGAYFEGANFEGAYLRGTSFIGANFEAANLKETNDLTVEQLSEVKTLYQAQLDPELEAELRAKGFGYLIDNEPEDDEP